MNRTQICGAGFRVISWGLLCGMLSLVEGTALSAADIAIPVRFEAAAHKKPYTGRVYLFTSTKPAEPRLGPSWFAPEQFFSMDVTDWQPGTDLVFSREQADKILGHPQSFADWNPGDGNIQAVVRFNPWERDVGRGPGNGFSAVKKLSEASGGQALIVNQLVPAPTFEETADIRLVSLRSPLLSDFHHQPVFLRAAVLLPASYRAEPPRRFPVVYVIPGFTGTHHAFHATKDPPSGENPSGVEFIRVILNPECPLGHHVFADSANNGPCGRALVEELIPEIDHRFRTVPRATARFVNGHSSGGWSSLWLQITYPESFGGVWSTAPDPVDFRDFQLMNLYRSGENAYHAPDGSRRPIARKSATEVALWYDDFDHMEVVLGPGGQLHSFDAVFSPRGEDGKPRPIWSRQTGAIDPAVAKAWEQYDIRLVLERNWAALGPRLSGKLHVFMGDQDTFYLEGATILLKESLRNLGSDAVVEIHSGKDHRTIITPELQTRMRQEMVESFLHNHPSP